MHLLLQLKLSNLFWVFVIVISFSINTLSQPMEYEMINYMAVQDKPLDPNDDEAIKRRFKTHFIKEVFLDKMLQSSHLYYSEEDSVDYGIFNEIASLKLFRNALGQFYHKISILQFSNILEFY